MTKMRYLAYAFLLLGFACSQSAPKFAPAQKLFNEWFPGQYQAGVLKGAEMSVALLEVTDKKNPQLVFTVDWANAEKEGALRKEALREAAAAAKINLPLAKELAGVLQRNALESLSLGVDLAKNRVEIALFENPFGGAFGARLSQLNGIVQDWARSQNWKACHFRLRVLSPEARDAYYPQVIDARLVHANSAWLENNTLVSAEADVLNPASVEMMPGTAGLGAKVEKELREKAYQAASEFLYAQATEDFHMEKNMMVGSELSLENLDLIVYSFPYCTLSEQVKSAGNCMGSFSGRVQVRYLLDKGQVEAVNLEDSQRQGL
jgi:hypothetical protein